MLSVLKFKLETTINTEWNIIFESLFKPNAQQNSLLLSRKIKRLLIFHEKMRFLTFLVVRFERWGQLCIQLSRSRLYFGAKGRHPDALSKRNLSVLAWPQYAAAVSKMPRR